MYVSSFSRHFSWTMFVLASMAPTVSTGICTLRGATSANIRCFLWPFVPYRLHQHQIHDSCFQSLGGNKMSSWCDKRTHRTPLECTSNCMKHFVVYDSISIWSKCFFLEGIGLPSNKSGSKTVRFPLSSMDAFGCFVDMKALLQKVLSFLGKVYSALESPKCMEVNKL